MSIGNVKGLTSVPDPSVFDIAIHANGASNLTWTSMSSARAFLGGSSRGAVRVDLTNYSQTRLVTYLSTEGANTAEIMLLYKAAPTVGAVGTFADIGTTPVKFSINVSGNQNLASSWTDLVQAAKNDVIIAVAGSGGDGVASPVFGNMHVQFR